MARVNPLLAPWTGPANTPDFKAFEVGHFPAALEIAIEESRREIAAITADPAKPDFDNTCLALERSGATLARVRRIFWMLASAQSDDALRGMEGDVAAKLTSFGTEVSQDSALFARIRAVWEQRDALSPEQARLVDRSYKGFFSGGAGLSPADQRRLAQIDDRLSALAVKFGQNVLDATNECAVILAREQLAGIPEDLIAAARDSGGADKPDKFTFVLNRGIFEGLLTFADDRSVREEVWRAFTGRCQSGAYDNLPMIAEIVALRQERAALLGFASYADYALEDSMAKTPEAAKGLMMRVWAPGLEQAKREQAALEEYAERTSQTGDDGGFRLEAWDWRYYAGRLRRELYAFDAAAVRAHLSLAKVRAAAFAAAGRLYGLSFEQRDDIAVYHPDVLAWSVSDGDGKPVGVLLTDYIARPEKSGGAWMGSLRVQERMDGPVWPIVYTVANFTCAGPGADALLSIDEARTLFHEFGHALHALLSDVTYPSLAGTSVARDFVEFPSKFMEHWVVSPEALRGFGVPDDLVSAIANADRFGQGFATIEFLASALVDLELHWRRQAPADVASFEAESLAALGTPSAVGMRHKLAYFTHVFDGGYASAYYSYLWSEVLDADAFEAFGAKDSLFDPGLAAKFRREVLAPGDSRDPMASFVAFRGRQPDEGALLRSRALA